MKKYTTAMIVLALIAAALLFAFASESEPIDSLFHAPAQDGGDGQIWNAIEKGAEGKYTLKTPTDGSHRSALVYTDLNDDGKNEVVAFYSTVKSGDSICMQILSQTDSGWVSSTGVNSEFNEIKQVEFADLDGDGKNEVVVGWGLQKNNIMQQISVYRFDEKNDLLTQIFDSKYTSFGLFDINSDEQTEIAVVSADYSIEPPVQKLALFSYSADKFRKISETEIDPSITTVSGLSFDVNRRTASSRIYVDGYVADGLLSTELLVFDIDSSNLRRCYIDGETFCTLTKRSINVFCSDINNDGIVEIPTKRNIEHGTGSFSLIEWKSLQRDEMKTVCYYFDNRENGYYFCIPSVIEDNSYPVLSEDGKRLCFYESDFSMQSTDDPQLLLELFIDGSGEMSLISTLYRYIDSHKGNSFYCRITERGSILGLTKKLVASSVIFV